MSDQRYLVTARKYRPAVFSELVAQEHVTETLKNAIRLDRLAHAYLFSGPRGVGKTTAARILAKAINCTVPLDERVDDAEPCRACEACRAFEEGRSLTIFEIDAASNNKVDDIRELRETVRIPPQGARKKVYIIDEVHMLSTAAFNALLKTLEEPPPHVLFIFATTEPHKVLPTILSRCQRFDFRRIPVPEIVGRLQTICAEEGITADEESLMLVARKGDGALRDALSVFDQAVSLCGTDLRYTELAEALRVVEVDLFFGVTQHVLERSAAGMLRLVDRIVHAGYDLQEFLGGLAEHLRNLLVASTVGDASLIEAAEGTRRRYAEAAPAFTEADLLRLLMLVDEAGTTIKDSPQPRMKLELALLKMASLAHTADLREALRQLDRLEETARQGSPPASASPAGPRSAHPSVVHEPSSRSAASLQAAPPLSPSRSDDPPFDEDDEPDAGAPPPVVAPSRPQSQPEPASPVSPSIPSLFSTPALKSTARPTSPKPAEDDPARSVHADVPTAVVAEPTAPPLHSASPSLGQVETVWPRFVQAVKGERIHVGALLEHAVPAGATASTITLGVPDDFHLRLLSSQEDFLCKHLHVHLPDIQRLLFEICDDAKPAMETPETFDISAYLQRKRQEDPVIRALLETFGSEPA